MKIDHTKELNHGHKIEIGSATWNESARSVRDRWPTANGGFSPRSSSEIPMESLPEIIEFAATHNELSIQDCCRLISALSDSIKRQTP